MSGDTFEQAFAELEKLCHKYADQEAQRVYLAEFRKAKKAILMKEAEAENPGMSAAAQEREAYAHPEYLEVLKGLQGATEVALLTKHLIETKKMRFEAWRTRQSTRRAEMNLR